MTWDVYGLGPCKHLRFWITFSEVLSHVIVENYTTLLNIWEEYRGISTETIAASLYPGDGFQPKIFMFLWCRTVKQLLDAAGLQYLQCLWCHCAPEVFLPSYSYCTGCTGVKLVLRFSWGHMCGLPPENCRFWSGGLLILIGFCTFGSTISFN